MISRPPGPCHGRERASSHYPPPNPPFRPQKAPGVTSRSVSKHPWHLNISQILRGVSLGQQPGRACGGVHPRFRVPENPRREICFPREGARWLPEVPFFLPQSQGERTCALLPVLLTRRRRGRVMGKEGYRKKLNDMCKGTTAHGREGFLYPRGSKHSSMHPETGSSLQLLSCMSRGSLGTGGTPPGQVKRLRLCAYSCSLRSLSLSLVITTWNVLTRRCSCAGRALSTACCCRVPGPGPLRPEMRLTSP